MINNEVGGTIEVSEKERESAGIIIQLNNGIITVTHLQNNTVLLQKNAKKGDWNKIWKTLEKLGQ